MKILIGYDGSECANDALEDLRNAGLPARAEVLVTTVTENILLILEDRGVGALGNKNFDYFDAETQGKLREDAKDQMAEAENLARAAVARIKVDFPHWDLRCAAVADYPERGIIEQAKKYRPDLIVVGSHGRGAVGRFLLGSFSLKVLNGALCSVRVARRSPARTGDDDSPTRVVIGIDGSPDSMLAVEAAAKRTWRQDSAARLVTAIEPLMHPLLEVEIRKVEEARRVAAQKLESAGLHVSTVTRLGAAKYVLAGEAEKWGADTIFIGARSHRRIERVLLGSVSYAVAARAHCSVEVVRDNSYPAFFA